MSHARAMFRDWYSWTGARQPTATDALAYLDYQLERGVIDQGQYERALGWVRSFGWRWLTGELVRYATEDVRRARRPRA